MILDFGFAILDWSPALRAECEKRGLFQGKTNPLLAKRATGQSKIRNPKSKIH